MKKKIVTALAALGMAVSAITASAFVAPAPASAQALTGRTVCIAHSPVAQGWGVSYDQASACRIALNQCSIRTPYNQVCYVTRWYYEAY
jgi:hypothetical protein